MFTLYKSSLIIALLFAIFYGVYTIDRVNDIGIFPIKIPEDLLNNIGMSIVIVIFVSLILLTHN